MTAPARSGFGFRPAQESASTIEAGRLLAWALNDPEREDALAEAAAAVLHAKGSVIAARNLRQVFHRAMYARRRRVESTTRPKD